MDNKNESKIKHLEFIQTVINRMAANSFMIKGWSITLVSALFALAAKDSTRSFVLIAYFPVVMLWLLDGYFLSQERCFRALYEAVMIPDSKVELFSMNTSPFKKEKLTFCSSACSQTLLLFHGAIFITVCIVMFAL